MASWKYLLQSVLYAAFIALIGYFSVAPAYRHAHPELAVIKLAFSHAAERLEPCRKLTPEELAQLAPNMRRPMECERERLPLLVELEIDGELVFRAEEPPTGLWQDGAATIYQKFQVQPGSHELVARLRDGRDTVGFDYEQAASVELAAGQNFVIGFRAAAGGFKFQ
ncbi:MAG: hypothetical protein JSV45_02135 [Chromatiales bacterium]|nr:MAG: hypothetical protein JSV45_02135 [Chromatiales bacterium]